MPSSSLELSEYRLYGRQMILDNFGLPGQLKLKAASVVVVGAGGLGCPALQYLAAAGIGRIGIIDHDRVETSNLQRQILHNEETVGMFKAESAKAAMKRLNSHVDVISYTTALVPANALELLAPFEIILDCTDNLPTRYLLSDAAVALKKPLVSGAAMRYEGQLCIYNLGANSSDPNDIKGPCFRCLFPSPPTIGGGTCEETGILGVVTGIIGNLQAAEAIKIILGQNEKHPTLLLYSFLSTPAFRSIKLRSRKQDCPACGSAATAGASLDINNRDYVQFCGGPTPDWEMLGLKVGDDDDARNNRVTPKELKLALDSKEQPLIIDVRPKIEFGICHLPNSFNIPLNEFVANPSAILTTTGQSTPITDIYVVCRLGNDSQIGADALRGLEASEQRTVRDLIGGLMLWAKEVDQCFPIY